MKEVKPGQKYRLKAYGLALLTGVAIVGLFFQAWRVYAYDVRGTVRHVESHDSHSSALATPQSTPTQTVPVAVKAMAPVLGSRWSDGEVVGALSSFYQTIITYMGILIGVMGILSVVTLRFFSKAAAEDMAHDAAKAAMHHYLETTKFREEVSYAVQEIGLSAQLELLEKDLTEVKKMLRARQPAAVDTSEDEEGTIGFPPENEEP